MGASRPRAKRTPIFTSMFSDQSGDLSFVFFVCGGVVHFDVHDHVGRHGICPLTHFLSHRTWSHVGVSQKRPSPVSSSLGRSRKASSTSSAFGNAQGMSTTYGWQPSWHKAQPIDRSLSLERFCTRTAVSITARGSHNAGFKTASKL
jgi:hypothetical protein